MTWFYIVYMIVLFLNLYYALKYKKWYSWFAFGFMTVNLLLVIFKI